MASRYDIVQISYEARTKGGVVFDSTSGDVAKKLYKKEGPIYVLLGVDKVVKGLEEVLYQLNEGEKLVITLPPEKAFGNKDSRLIKVVPLEFFKNQNITPLPGVSFTLPSFSVVGKIKSVSGGRVLVDFNHPYAGEEITYEVKLEKIIKDRENKIRAICEKFGLKEISWKLDEDRLEMSGKIDAQKKAFLGSLCEKVLSIREVMFV